MNAFLSSSIGLLLTTRFTSPISNQLGAAMTTLGIYGMVTSLGIACIPKKICSSRTVFSIAAGGLISAALAAQLPTKLAPQLRIFSFMTIGIAPAIAVLKNIPFRSFQTINLNEIQVFSGG